MKILKKLVEIIYALLVIVLSVFLIIIPFDFSGKFSVDSIIMYIDYLRGNYLFSLIGLLILIISIKYLLSIFSFEGRKEPEAKYMTINNEYGDVTIYDETVSGLVENVSKEFAGIDNIRTLVDFEDNQINIKITGEAENEISIPQISGELQKRIKKNVEDATGAVVNSTSVKITKIKNKDN